MAATVHTDSARPRSESPLLVTDGAPSSKKRFRDAGDESTKQPSKKSKKKQPKDIDDAAIDSDHNVNHAIAHMDSSLMADHIAQRTKRFRPDISVVESDDLHIPAIAIRDTTEFSKPRTAEHLVEYIEQFAGSKGRKKLTNSSPEKGSPHTIIVAGAGLRAADLTRSVRKFQTKDSMVAKLFAKHIKLKEASEMVSKTRIGVSVGTPQRLIDLVENGSLKLDALDRIVIDASHIDQKKRGILDMKEVQVPLVALLTRADLKDRYAASQRPLELLFF